MSTAKITHAEQWRITITPDGDPWADIPVNRMMIRPEALLVELWRSQAQLQVYVRGRQVRKDGTPGTFLRTLGLGYGNPVPEWAAEIIESVRRQNNLGPGVTGVDW